MNLRPRRTVRVVRWTNEENGAAGRHPSDVATAADTVDKIDPLDSARSSAAIAG